MAAKAAKKPPTKSEILGHISTDTGLTRKEVGAVFESRSRLADERLEQLALKRVRARLLLVLAALDVGDDVGAVFESLSGLMKKNLSTRGPELFTMPGLFKVKVVKKPATKARKGINPFTGEEMMFKAKPARKTVKVLALKGMKEMV